MSGTSGLSHVSLAPTLSPALNLACLYPRHTSAAQSFSYCHLTRTHAFAGKTRVTSQLATLPATAESSSTARYCRQQRCVRFTANHHSRVPTPLHTGYAPPAHQADGLQAAGKLPGAFRASPVWRHKALPLTLPYAVVAARCSTFVEALARRA